MNVALPLFFGAVAIGSVLVIWHTVASNVSAIAALHRQIVSPGVGGDIIVSLKEATVDFGPLHALRRTRQVRVPSPKPVTHRLHHFAKDRTFA
jgi:hypothetical protein